MEAKDHGEHSHDKNSSICCLEWIAWAIDAARRHKQHEHRYPPARPRPALTLVKIDCTRR
jgi:hypothetical protein